MQGSGWHSKKILLLLVREQYKSHSSPLSGVTHFSVILQLPRMDGWG